MQTHRDEDFRRDFMTELENRAERAKKERTGEITAGSPGEKPLAQWKSNGVWVRKMPNDKQDILRISIGGGNTPVPLNYCVFRGNHGQCVDLLRKALAALEGPRED